MIRLSVMRLCRMPRLNRCVAYSVEFSEGAGEPGARDSPIECKECSSLARLEVVAVSEWCRAVAAFEGDAAVDLGGW